MYFTETNWGITQSLFSTYSLFLCSPLSVDRATDGFLHHMPSHTITDLVTQSSSRDAGLAAVKVTEILV